MAHWGPWLVGLLRAGALGAAAVSTVSILGGTLLACAAPGKRSSVSPRSHVPRSLSPRSLSLRSPSLRSLSPHRRQASEPRDAAALSRRGVTCLKPACGLEPGLEENFRAMLDQDYPGPLQFLWVVESAHDPAHAVLERLRTEHPGKDITLTVAGAAAGGSQKLHNLAHAERAARHPLLCVSDSDVRPGRGVLRALVEELEADARTGAVCASVFYTGARNLPARAFQAFTNSDVVGVMAFLELIGHADVLIGGMHVLRRSTLAAVGGYEALGHHISDDGALGMRLAAHGYRVRASREPVAMVLPRESWRGFLAAGHRWWLMARVCAPRRFALGLVLCGPFYGMLLFLAALIAGRLDAAAWAAGPALAGLHVVTCAWTGRRRGPAGMGLGYAWLRPAVDVMCFLFWWMALLWPRIHWRGHGYVVRPDGFAVPLERAGGARLRRLDTPLPRP